MTTTTPSLVVFSGGTACNHIAKSFHELGHNDITYFLGVSDNGGSTSEILRVLGGPSIGDLRSRLTRLIDIIDPNPSDERVAIKELLSYRLSNDPEQVKDEWASIVEGRHRLWKRIPADKKETIRGFLTNFNGETLKRAHKRFNFCNGSIGNFFLTGARLFFGSLEAALFLFSAITGISEPTMVVPVINTNHQATIAAQLQNGETIIGQCNISHPSSTTNAPDCHSSQLIINPIDAFMHLGDDPIPTTRDDYMMMINKTNSTTLDDDDDNDNNGKHVTSNLFFSKLEEQPLPSPIRRLYYINEYGQEIYPVPNPKVITQLSTKNTLIYSIGSLYTSIVPSLILRNVGNAIAQSQSLQYKILLLNGSNDRETRGYSALDFILTITAALNESQKIDCRRAFYQTNLCERGASSYSGRTTHGPTQHLCSGYKSSLPPPPPPSLSSSTSIRPDSGYASFSSSPTHHYPPFPDQLFQPSPPNAFISHLVYLDQGEISVDVSAIEQFGIQCVKVKGHQCASTGKPIYDDVTLTNVLRTLCI
ncbi:uncharacterized protein BX664DRAFT_292789 [Halteromyces radiatus]|uniref:uncharacterized protein n=1 Tax=Halteromyces radiatus TaxID=101107 RepID=UPI00221ECF8F|nr:uncharacterized protein BX664DRAFT_292789 [Halteromyces radiatus]KAI8097314.1 hypothetical protein BX664DRAFT_292789 [Halteromyces radiatus]